ncbi:MAG: hypothetical protein U9Q81_23935 [Pseudomonadota bacterium]|nr:hypothetical protein [Pseudomonadota bacterium]
MSGENRSKQACELCRLEGAVNVLEDLREELEQWLEEAQDDSKREALENVVGHVGALEEEYTRRRTALSEATQDD